VVLSREEIGAILKQVTGTERLIVMVLYGSGVRLEECLDLRVKDLDFDRHQIIVRQGKGQKDRATILPTAAREGLTRHLADERRLHERDLASGFGRVVLPLALDRKFPHAATEWRWQFVFPAARMCRAPPFGPPSRYHLHESVVQKAVAEAARLASITKRVSPHAMRHYAAFRTMPSPRERNRERATPSRASGRDLESSARHSLAALQPLEECEQLVLGPVSTRRWSVRWSGLCQRLFLEREVGLEVHLGGFDRFVAQPEGNDGAVYARLQQFHGRRVSQYVRRDVFLQQRWATTVSCGDVLVHQVLDAIGAERPSSRVRKHPLAVGARGFLKPRLECLHGLLGERRAALLAALADAAYMCAGAEHDILAAEAGHLRKPQPCLYRD